MYPNGQPGYQYPGYPPQPGQENYPQVPGYPPFQQQPYPGMPMYPQGPVDYQQYPQYPQQPPPQGYPQYPPEGYPQYPQQPPQGYPQYPQQPPTQEFPQYPQQPPEFYHQTQVNNYEAAPSYQEEVEASDEEYSDDDESEYGDEDGDYGMFRGNPTVVPADPFDPMQDAADLRKAMKGFGTDEDKLIEILAHRSSDQRQEIAEAFEKAYGKSLKEKIKSETSGKFENLLIGLLTPWYEFYCKELKEPMRSKKVLVEVLCSLLNYEIEQVKTCYSEMYGQDLEDAILGSGDTNYFQTLMIALTRAEKDESGEIDVEVAKGDANSMIECGIPFEPEGYFEQILCKDNYDQIKQTMREYQMMKGKSFLKTIKKSFSGDEKKGMIHVFRCINNKSEFFAHQLHDAMEGLGTNDEKLIRLIVTRSAIDMVEIKAAFQRLFKKSLKEFIKADTGGDYKHCLYALIGEKRS